MRSVGSVDRRVDEEDSAGARGGWRGGRVFEVIRFRKMGMRFLIIKI